MLPRLRAQGVLDQMSAVALGTGALKRADAARLLRSLERLADGRRPRAGRPGAAALAAMGIEVEEA